MGLLPIFNLFYLHSRSSPPPPTVKLCGGDFRKVQHKLELVSTHLQLRWLFLFWNLTLDRLSRRQLQYGMVNAVLGSQSKFQTTQLFWATPCLNHCNRVRISPSSPVQIRCRPVFFCYLRCWNGSGQKTTHAEHLSSWWNNGVWKYIKQCSWLPGILSIEYQRANPSPTSIEFFLMWAFRDPNWMDGNKSGKADQHKPSWSEKAIDSSYCLKRKVFDTLSPPLFPHKTDAEWPPFHAPKHLKRKRAPGRSIKEVKETTENNTSSEFLTIRKKNTTSVRSFIPNPKDLLEWEIKLHYVPHRCPLPSTRKWYSNILQNG